MRNCYLTAAIIFCITFFDAIGQDYIPSNHKYIFKKANKLFDDYAYQDALDIYRQLLDSKSQQLEIKLQIAECYRYLNNPRKAAQYYADIINNDEITQPIHQFYYADALFKIGHYQKAQEWLQKYQQKEPKDLRVARIVKAIKHYTEFFKDSSLYAVQNLKVNSNESDFGPAYFDGGIVFASSRIDPGALTKQKYKRDNSIFLDLYYSKQRTDCTMSAVVKFNPKVNSKYHESSTVFFDDEQQMLFTRNNYYEKKLLKSSTGDVNLKLFQAHRGVTGAWLDIMELPFNSDEYSTGHPAITNNGKTIYFVSDKAGGYGATDIYFSQWENGAWGEPENLGEKVNTEGRELFPFIHNDGFLYFASDGHYGMGGLDIYQFDLKTHELINPGYPINTRWDDFALIRDRNGTSGFLSSNREGGRGSDDIYRFIQLFLNVEVIVVNAFSNDPVPATQVLLFENGVVVDSAITDSKGIVELKVLAQKDFKIKVVNEHYALKQLEFSTQQNLPGELVKLTLSLDNFMNLYGRVYQAEDMTILPNAEVSVINEITGEEQDLKSDENGAFEIKLQKTGRYTLVGQHGKKTGMLLGYIPSDTGPDSVQLLLNSQILAVEEDQLKTLDNSAKTALLGKGVRITGPIEIDNIYYKFDRWGIVQEAAEELGKIVQIMKDNPTLKIELSSHTDARGSADYNQQLSEKRAKSAVEFMVKQGIDAQRLVAKGYGESRLINHCQEFKDCSEELHGENRRTEFEVLEF